MLCRWPPMFVESGKEIAISRYKTCYGMNVHKHVGYFELEYIISGNCRQNITNESYELSRGDVVLFKIGSSHEFYTTSEIEVLKILIKSDYMPEIYREHSAEFELASIIHLPSNEVRRFENILFMIEDEFKMQNEFFLEVITGYLGVLFALLIRINRMSKSEDRKASVIDFKLILTYIENNLNTVTPNSVAVYSGYNFPYFSKMFKKHVGTNLSEYINSKKLEAAQKLLLESNETLENIAYKVGFNHKSYFHRLFKKYYGVTPDEYRKAK